MSEQPIDVPRLAARRHLAKVEQESSRAATDIGMLPSSINLTIYQGDDFFLDLVVVSEPPVDLSAYTPQADIRAVPGSSSILATFDATIASPSKVSLHLTSAESTKLSGVAYWDVQITDAAGIVTTLAAGSVTVVKQVTR